jgi:hypothetical protein
MPAELGRISRHRPRVVVPDRKETTMSVGSIDPSSTTTQANQVPSQFQQLRKSFAQLAQDLQAGNLAGAQQDYAAIQQNLPPGAASNGQAQSGLQAIGTALQAGNIGAAQQALSSLQAAHGGHGAHGGGGGGGSGGSSSSSSSKTIVNETSNTAADGETTTVITYSDGTSETTTSYGAPTNTTQSLFA